MNAGKPPEDRAGAIARSLLAVICTAIVASFLLGLGQFLHWPPAPADGLPPIAMRLALIGDSESREAIAAHWRLGAGRWLLGGYLLVASTLFAPLCAWAGTRTLALLAQMATPGDQLPRLRRVAGIAAVLAIAADWGESGLIAAWVLPAQAATEGAWHTPARLTSLAKWSFVALALIASLAAASPALRATRPWTAAKLRNYARRALESLRDAAAYLWLYCVPLGMLFGGIGVLLVLPQTREVLLGLQSTGALGRGNLALGVLALVAWLVSTGHAFRLLDGLPQRPITTMQPGAAAEGHHEPASQHLRLGHQLLLGMGGLLASTQLITSAIDRPSAALPLLVLSGSLSLWVVTVRACEFGCRRLELPLAPAASVVSERLVAGLYVAMLLTAAAWAWLPRPDAWILDALGFYQKPDRVWRHNPQLFDAENTAIVLIAIATTTAVLWAVGRSRTAPRSHTLAWLVGGSALSAWAAASWQWMGAAFKLQVLVVVPMAVAVWLLLRLAGKQAYSDWLASREQQLATRLDRYPRWLTSIGMWAMRDQLSRLSHLPWAALFFVLLLVLVAHLNDVGETVRVGTLTIVFTGISVWGLVYTAVFVYWPKKHGLGNWVLAPLVWSALVSTGPKYTQEAAAEARAPKREAASAWPQGRVPTIHEHFPIWHRGLPPAWHEGLPDQQASPVFIVSAAGGGLRATYWTAMLLAEMDDRTCGQFGRHVFAISGVSGGSLGAALYAAQRRVWEAKPLPQRCDPGRAAQMSQLLRSDFLSPVAASLLFADLPQSLVPFRYLRNDRSQALSRAVELRWEDVFGHGHKLLMEPLPQALPAFWPAPGAAFAEHPGPNHPLLYLNATGAETGRRVIASNVELLDIAADALYDGRLLTADTSLLNAAMHSARFPGVSPAGTLWACSTGFVNPSQGECSGKVGRGVAAHLLDGGYFENSGLETLNEAWQSLSTAGSLSVHKELPPVFLIAISNDRGTPLLCGNGRLTPRVPRPGGDVAELNTRFNLAERAPRFTVPEQEPGGGLTTAVSALLAVREGRARLELERSVRKFRCPSVIEWSLGELLSRTGAAREVMGAQQEKDADEQEPALGWMLSKRSFDLMDRGVRIYADAFPIDQRACEPRSERPRAYIGGEKDEARRCLPEPAPIPPREPIRAEDPPNRP